MNIELYNAAEAVRDSILGQVCALDISSDMLTDIILTAGDTIDRPLPFLGREQIAELEAQFIRRFHETDPDHFDRIIFQAVAIEEQLLGRRRFSFWCALPEGDAHWIGAKPAQRWAHAYCGDPGQCMYIQLCEECARECWPQPEEDYTPDDCAGVFFTHEYNFLARTDPQFNQW